MNTPISPTQQIFSALCQIVPAFTDQFSIKYVLKSISYNYTTGIATASMSPADITNLVASGNLQFTITNVNTQHNIISAEWTLGLLLKINFGVVVDIPIGTQITLQGFIPIDYNTKWTVDNRNDDGSYNLRYDIDLNPTLLNKPTITQIGYFLQYVRGNGFNGIQNVTIDQTNNVITFPLTPQNILSVSATVHTLSGGEIGVGYLHDWHNNILIADSRKIYQQFIAEKKNILCVVSDDFTIRSNQEKFFNRDTNSQNDISQSLVQRMLCDFHIDYIYNVTGSMKSNIEADAMSLFSILFPICGRRFTIPNLINPNLTISYLFSFVGYEPQRDQNGGLLRVIRYTLNAQIQFMGGNLLYNAFYDSFNLDQINILFPNQQNNFNLT